MHRFTNKLIDETSPYLLQHAHNPVDWYPWSEEALKKAKEEDRPILVSIGYSACHWCHVMERESFENEETARLMNEHFVNIKIDREERPDLDHIYMDAVQAMTGSGGWPLNVFLTPEGKPFYGGTYFPPKPAFNRGSWTDILTNVAQAFKEKRHEIDAQAENLTDHLLQANALGLQSSVEGTVYDKKQLDEIFTNCMKNADREWGGFGRAPKFPQSFTIQFLLRYHHTTGSEEALEQAMLSLDKMIEGGIYDQAGGGFARYSTDTEWLAPHFEKMLYDNALLVSVLAEAYQLTGHERYRQVIAETIGFLEREMLHASGGFYSALDADSEGVEGKFYVWELEEINELLGDDARIFAAYYDITEKGNWEEKNILRVKKKIDAFASEHKLEVSDLEKLLEKGKQKILERRALRIRPGLDDKIILGWNALMNTAASKAYAATGEERYRQLAVTNMHFLLEKFKTGRGDDLHHTWKNDQAKYPAFLDDYAYLVQALIHLQEVTGDSDWLVEAGRLTTHVMEQFSDEEGVLFYFTSKGQSDVIVRKKELYDGAVPSGNSVMAYNMYQLGILFGRQEWKNRSERMVASLSHAIIKYPTSFGVWAGLLQEIATGTTEIIITGDGLEKTLREVLALYAPNKVLMAEGEEGSWPLMEGKPRGGKIKIWLCRNYHCLTPVSTAAELRTLINRGKTGN